MLSKDIVGVGKAEVQRHRRRGCKDFFVSPMGIAEKTCDGIYFQPVLLRQHAIGQRGSVGRATHS